MKLTVAKENGKFEITLAGEAVPETGTVTREITLFPGQTARISVRRYYSGGEVLAVDLDAERNGEKKGLRVHEYLHSEHALRLADLPDKIPIARWIQGLTEWAKKIPLREEVEIEF